MEKYDIGKPAVCGLCKEPTTVVTRRLYENKMEGFELGCGHRNGYCRVCDDLVMDASDTGGEIHPMCSVCITAQFEEAVETAVA